MTADAGLRPVLPRWLGDHGGDAAVLTRRPREEGRAPAGAGPIERVRAALSDLAAGRPVVVVDHEDRGDLVVASELATPQAMAFMVRHTSGFVCVAVTGDDADRLDLPLMVRTARQRPGAAQCVAVDARAGVSTGISATDRARTIRLLAAEDTDATDLVRPGHVVPLRTEADGVLGHPGRAEAAVDLAVLAGLRPSGALCELVSTARPSGMARGAELDAFACEHGLQLVAISDLVAYRMRFEKLIERGVETTIPLATGRFTAVGYRSRIDGSEHLALVHGEIGDGEEVLVYVHRECLVGDVLGSTGCRCGGRLQSALASVVGEGRGVVVYLRGGQGDGAFLEALVPPPHQCPGDQPPVAADPGLRDHSIGGQILRDLGIRSSRTLSADRPEQRCAVPAVP